jgi:hypothetical protein
VRVLKNSRKLTCIWLCGVAGALVLTLSACQKEVEPDITIPASTTVRAEVSECLGSFGGRSLDDTDSPLECMEWSLDGAGTLSLKHVNAVYNCCIDSITVTTTIGGNVIEIVETEYLMNGGCDCVCPYNITFQISDVAAEPYTIQVFAKYSYGEEPVLLFEFTLDLGSTPTGSFCP